ncbi:hypothetical protein D046_4734A, partial [Vibrio parahaemolyticus V-223/04]
MSNPFYFIRYL